MDLMHHAEGNHRRQRQVESSGIDKEDENQTDSKQLEEILSRGKHMEPFGKK